jgi:hypothetical protein
MSEISMLWDGEQYYVIGDRDVTKIEEVKAFDDLTIYRYPRFNIYRTDKLWRTVFLKSGWMEYK